MERKKKKKGKERGKKQKKEREGGDEWVERGKGRKGEGQQLGIKASGFFPLSF